MKETREAYIRKEALTVIELTKGFSTNPVDNAMVTLLQFTNYILELTDKPQEPDINTPDNSRVKITETFPDTSKGAKQYNCNHIIGAADDSGKCFKCGEIVSKTIHLSSAKQRAENIFDFVVRHKTLIYQTTRFYGSFTSGKHDSQLHELITLARKEIGYSDKTWSGDIFNSLIKQYMAITIEGNDEPMPSIMEEQEQPVQSAEAKESVKSRKEIAEKWFDENGMKYRGLLSRHHAVRMISDYHKYATQKHIPTDEEIEKNFPTNIYRLAESLHIPQNLMSAEMSEALRGIQEGNENKQIGAKWLKDKIK